MTQHSKHFSLSACALAVSLLLSACGGAESTDTVAPTVAITDNVAGATAAGAVTFTFTFSEDVGSSFAAEDITVTGGTAGALTKVDAMHYTLVVTPAASATGTISVSVAAARFRDIALNDNTATATASQAFDTTQPVVAGTVVADFDTVVPVVRDTGDTGGIAAITTTPPVGGGSGSALELLRTPATDYALSVLNATVPFTSTRKTLSARVYSPTAGIPMKIKLEAGGPSVNTGDIVSNETVVVGWQTLTWTFNPDLTKTYDAIVLLPNIGTVDAAPGKKYYFDEFKLLAATGGGGGGGTPTPTPPGDQGSGGPQTLTIATGDVKTGDGGNTMFVAGEGLFAVNYVGSAEANPPNNLAAWPNAKTASFSGITGISAGDIGYFQDDVNLSNSIQKVEEGGWVSGTALAPLGVPNFFRYFVLKGNVSTNAYMGLYMNAPNNGTVNVSGFSKIKVKVWGPGPMFNQTNFSPVLEVTLAGPKVAGCTTGSGGSEITQNLTANRKNGAGGFDTLPLSGFTVKGLCGTDTLAANVLAKLARVVVTVPGSSFNYTNAVDGNYTTGLNLGPVGFTNK